jgi:DMSO/TMAO reductase YedYZ molybdopterin-dependent catalytic subunit
MNRPWPAGQRELTAFPRFGLLQFVRRFPAETSRRELRITGDVANELVVADVLDGLPRVEQVSDFHCVTTWSRRGLCWGGVRFADFYEQVIAPQARPLADARTFILRGQDGARTTMLLEDLLAPDVLIATTLDGAPLSIEHGAPMRLIAPAHYAYKSVKHLSRIEICTDESRFRPAAFRFMDHPHARVASEERGRGLPGWLLRTLYRPLVSTTARYFAKAMEDHRNA